MSDREVRPAPDPGVFNARPLVGTPDSLKLEGPWWRLSRKGYPSEFFPSPGSRLTPISRVFPCVYLACDHKTVVGEIFGDRFARAQGDGKSVFKIATTDATTYAYRRIDALPAPLTICDLIDPDVLTSVGIDASTLYTTDLKLTQEWAERIARHPAQFDGILYPSRHTFQKCIVLWNRPGAPRDLEKEITFLYDAEFLHSPPAYAAAAMRGLRLSFT